jgi:hypothetical protein
LATLSNFLAVFIWLAGFLGIFTSDLFSEFITSCSVGAFALTVKKLAKGIRFDYAAVKLAFSSEWSNGQVEAQVNCLKRAEADRV